MKTSPSNLTVLTSTSAQAESCQIELLDEDRIVRAKTSYATRRVRKDAIQTLISGQVSPEPGDLVLAQVKRIGQHTRLELTTGRRAPMFVGDEIIVAYGNRYAPDQFEGEVPDSLEACSLLAAGGVAARLVTRHSRMKRPTQVQPLGLLADANGRVINLADWALPHAGPRTSRPLSIAVVGTSMNAGKTTTAAHLIRGLTKAGVRVGAAKVTGTGAGGDTWLMQDAGARVVVDFTDAGHVSTYQVPLCGLEGVFEDLTGHLASQDVDVIVVEVADGLFQAETAGLVSSPVFLRGVDGLVFAAGDAMGAVAGVDWLRKRGHQVVAISGSLTASPLALREAEAGSDLPILGTAELEDPRIFDRLNKWIGANDPRMADARR